MTSSTATAVIGVLCLVNIVLTLGVIRRLGEHTRLLTQNAPGQAQPAPLRVRPGERVGDFAVTSVGGLPVSRADLKGSTLIGFMAPGCPSCEASLPDFIARAESAAGGRDDVMAVVLGTSPGADELCDQLAPVARVLTEEEEGGPLVLAFGVGALPAFALLSGDTMVASYPAPERIPDPAAV